MRAALLAIAGLVGCASAGSGEDLTPNDGPRRDGSITNSDAPVTPDARPDAPPDAPPPPPDACIPQVTQLLNNALLDLEPRGTGWVEQLIQNGFPPITADTGGAAAHTPPYRAWMGGFDTGGTDSAYQDVAIPALTSQLVLTGQFEVRSAETSTTTAYDFSQVQVSTTADSLIQLVMEKSNLNKTTVWTPFAHTFTQNLSGQTVRLRLRSTGDGSLASSFFYDTLALTATHGCP